MDAWWSAQTRMHRAWTFRPHPFLRTSTRRGEARRGRTKEARKAARVKRKGGFGSARALSPAEDAVLLPRIHLLEG